MTKEKIKLLQENLKVNEGIIISSDVNRFYLTGFSSSAGYVAITPKKAILLIDFRYYEKAKSSVSNCEVILLKNLKVQLSEIFLNSNISKIYLETDYLTLSGFKALKTKLDKFELSTEEKIQKQINELRSIKTNQEIEFIKKAQEMTVKTFSYILNNIKVGRTEREIMLDMEFFMRGLGSEGEAFDFIVVSGKNSSLPHGVPTDKKIEIGDFITMDFGAVYNGYRSDMTRTVMVGKPTEKQIEIYDTVLKAQEAAIEAIKPNAVCKNIDKIARDIIINSGYGENFGHGLGHSVGLEIHENPACNTACEDKLQAGMIMTVEPGIYIENEFGVRIEDMVVVTENGNDNLTNSSKELIVL